MAPVARYAYHWNIPVITTGGQNAAFRDKKGEKTDFRLLTTVSSLDTKALTDFFAKFVKKKTDWYVIIDS